MINNAEHFSIYKKIRKEGHWYNGEEVDTGGDCSAEMCYYIIVSLTLLLTVL